MKIKPATIYVLIALIGFSVSVVIERDFSAQKKEKTEIIQNNIDYSKSYYRRVNGFKK